MKEINLKITLLKYLKPYTAIYKLLNCSDPRKNNYRKQKSA